MGASDLGLSQMLEVRGQDAPAAPALESVVAPQTVDTPFDAREPRLRAFGERRGAVPDDVETLGPYRDLIRAIRRSR